VPSAVALASRCHQSSVSCIGNFQSSFLKSEKFTQTACTLQQIATDTEKQLARDTEHSCARQNKNDLFEFFWVCLPADTHRNDPNLLAIVAPYAQAYNCAGRERITLLTAYLRDA
jgi:hypothetical protein